MNSSHAKIWHTINFSQLPLHDPMLACLVLLSRYYQNPQTGKTLTARLPLINNKLSIETLPRAAKRAHLNCKEISLPLEEINNNQLPAILLLDDNEVCLMFADEKGIQQVIKPDEQQPYISLDDIKQRYQGNLIEFEPEYQFSERSSQTLKQEKKNWFWSVMKRSLPTYYEVIVASLLINLFALVVPLFTMNVYDRVVPNQAIETMWVLASGVIIIFCFDFAMKSLRAYFLDKAAKRSDIDLSSNIFEHMMGISMMERPKSVGSFANTIQSFETFRDFIASSTITILIDLPFSILFIFIIYLIGGNLFLVPTIVIPFVFFVGIVLQWPLIKLTKMSYKFAAEKQAILFESIYNAESVKTSSAESSLQSRYEQIIKEASANNLKLRFWSNISINLTTFSQQAATVAMVIAGVYKIGWNELTMGALIACTILTGRALAPMAQVASVIMRYFQSVNALNSLDKVMNLSTDYDNNSQYLHRPNLTGNISFKKVNFSFKEDENPVLHDITFGVHAGEKVAIIGRVGSGKSTIAKLILKLYTPTAGSILIDGTDYIQINPADLRQQIAYVPQDVSLFYGTIRDNITIGSPFVDDKELIRACNIAGIGSFTNQHPQGLDRQVGEKGSELSGGQRQAVAIARALLNDPKIIVFDEPTTSMDDNSERIFKAQLKTCLTKNHTMVMITHKYSMLSLVDRIIVVDDGRIVADGPKDAVISALKSGMAIAKGEESDKHD
ncbi:type I secretion system permease/ATPase [Legionella sp. W05-934-2]|jgi:ATP-binding cassette subfamily C protein LapB|uniref:type I secretion system permease/ATPase n=1 Tax=Legionella sp. W05-934-2 TaxID=1198649 RepID=UPI00346243ED